MVQLGKKNQKLLECFSELAVQKYIPLQLRQRRELLILKKSLSGQTAQHDQSNASQDVQGV
jgi:hypothetical protein